MQIFVGRHIGKTNHRKVCVIRTAPKILAIYDQSQFYPKVVCRSWLCLRKAKVKNGWKEALFRVVEDMLSGEKASVMLIPRNKYSRTNCRKSCLTVPVRNPNPK